MIFLQPRLQNADAGADAGSSATLMTDGAQTTPAASSPAPVDAAAAKPADQAGATQQRAEQTADAQADADAAAATPEKVAPDKYEFKAPDGTTLDTEAVGEFEGLAKEFKLSQDEAQKVADIGARMAQKWEAKQTEAIQTAAAEWAATATADKEYGGDKLTDSLTTAKRALDAFGTPELRSLLNDSRLGNHPEVIRFMVRAGKAISEDRVVTGGAAPAASASVAKSLYPNQS